MIEDKIFSHELSDKHINEGSYAHAARLLLENQKQTWPQLASGYSSLESVEVKTFSFGGFEIKVQFNPGRIISSSAKVDSASIKERKCFLCVQNLPAEQKGIPYGSGCVILANPFPIFPEHFTIPKISHVPQQIEGNFGGLLNAARDMSDLYVLFYNGPRCGASAPDHFHYQAGSKGFMTIDNDYGRIKEQYGEVLINEDNIKVFAVDDGLRKFIALESFDSSKLEDAFNKFYAVYKDAVNGAEEPMMNILCYYSAGEGWRVIIFMRSKHRSSHYFAEDDTNILLSAASVDLGGVCILPLEKDFKKITKSDLVEVFSEISISSEDYNIIKSKLKN